MANIDIAIGTSVSSANTLISAANPGDVIRFERGGTYVGMVSLNGISGASGNPIIITSYGSGLDPILTTRTSLPGFSTGGNWTDMGGNVWRKALAINDSNSNHRFWLNGTEYSRSETSATVNSTKRTSYNVDVAAFLYVYATSNPASFYTTIEYNGVDQCALLLANLEYITIQGIDIRGGIGASLVLDFSNLFIIENCNIGFDAGKAGIRKTGTCDDIIIRDNVIDSGDRLIDDFLSDKGIADGVWMGGGCTNWKIYRNWVKDWGHSCIEMSNVAGSDTSITNNEVYENYITAANVDYCRGIGFDSLTGRTATGNKVYRNYIHNTNVQTQLNCPGLEFTYNIINNTTNSTTGNPGVGRGIDISGYSNTSPINMKLYNNVIANCESEGLRISHSPGYGALSGNEFKNNIFFNNGALSPFDYNDAQIILVPQDSIGANTFQNNILYKSGVTDRIYYDYRNTGNEFMTIAEFNALNGTNSDVISGNLNVDPLFTNSTSNFTLQSSSPAKEGGLDLGSSFQNALAISSTWPDNVTTVVQAASWNIGSFGLSSVIGVIGYGRIPRIRFLLDTFNRALLSPWIEYDPGSSITVTMDNPNVTIAGGAFTICSRNINYNTLFTSAIKSWRMVLRFSITVNSGGISIGVRNPVNPAPSWHVMARLEASNGKIQIWSGDGSTTDDDSSTQRDQSAGSLTLNTGVDYEIVFTRSFSGSGSAFYNASMYLVSVPNTVVTSAWEETAAETQSQAQYPISKVTIGAVSGTHVVKSVLVELLN